jgi:pimeloyl-ACP methyl ester carboxylesterase
MRFQTIHKKWFWCWSAVYLLLGGVAFAGSPADGSWEGKLQTGGVSLRIVFNISTASDGSLKATMDSPDQGGYGIGVDSVSFADNQLRCEIKRISGVFEGKFTEANRTIDGFWTQFGVPMTLTLQPKAAVVRNRPQEPKPPFPYLAEEVSFENTKAGLKLAGTLTRPSGSKQAPAVVLITGSGQQNRDEEIMGHKPFLVLADSLTRRGIAVLRVDDRGMGGSASGPNSATSEDFAGDVAAAIEYLQSRRDIDKKHIGLIGHSEGGMIAPMLAANSKDVAFIVMLAGPGVRGVDVIVKQSDLVLEAQKVPAIARATNARIQQKLIDIAMHSKDDAEALAAFDAWWAERSKAASGPFTSSDSETATLKNVGDQLRSQFMNYLSPWMRFFLAYDPAPTLAKVRCPVLAINGSLDLQVPSSQNLPAVEAALKAGGNKDYTARELPGLNHLFQAAKTGAPSEYIEIEETINPAALELIGDWVAQHAGARRR